VRWTNLHDVHVKFSQDLSVVVTPPPIAERSIDERVCVCVCPRSYLRNYTSDLHQNLSACYYGRGSVLLGRGSDMLCTSGFVDDVIFAHKYIAQNNLIASCY